MWPQRISQQICNVRFSSLKRKLQLPDFSIRRNIFFQLFPSHGILNRFSSIFADLPLYFDDLTTWIFCVLFGLRHYLSSLFFLGVFRFHNGHIGNFYMLALESSFIQLQVFLWSSKFKLVIYIFILMFLNRMVIYQTKSKYALLKNKIKQKNTLLQDEGNTKWIPNITRSKSNKLYSNIKNKQLNI